MQPDDVQRAPREAGWQEREMGAVGISQLEVVHPAATKKKSKKHILTISLIVVLGLAGHGCAYLGWQPPQENVYRNERQTVQQQKEESECQLTRQSAADGLFDKEAVAVIEWKTYLDAGKIIGRVLSASPFVVDVYDIKYAHDIDIPISQRQVRIHGDLLVKVEVLGEVSKLRFNDLIEAKTHFTYYSAEKGKDGEHGSPALNIVVYEIKKIAESPIYSHSDVSSSYYVNRSGTLIKYVPERSNSNGLFIIFNDGKLFYRNNRGDILSGHSLPDQELNALLRGFSQVNFDKIRSAETFMRYRPSITLICSRFQHVLIEGNKESLKPLIDTLNSIIVAIEVNFDYALTYKEARKLDIQEWPFKEMKLTQWKELREEALREYRKTGNVKEGSVIYTKLPQSLWDQLPPAFAVPNENNDLYFIEEGRLYRVTKAQCMAGSSLCKVGTFYALSVGLVREYEDSSPKNRGIRLWPNNSTVRLLETSPEGKIEIMMGGERQERVHIIIERDEYLALQDFYDNMWNNIFIQDGYIFNGIHFKKIDKTRF